uniref:cytochrome P450 n=1 Tax=Nocardia noduli TaxID=2815722 RepID=UPI001C2224E3
MQHPQRHQISVDELGSPYPLWTQQFAADPHQAYRDLRVRFGSVAPVELSPGVPATLVLGYRQGIAVLNDPRFSADPRGWENSGTIPAGCPILPMLEWRPNSLRSGPPDHARYRRATTDALTGFDPNHVSGIIESVTTTLVNRFCDRGEADLLSEFARPLVFTVINDILGCPADIGAQIATALAAMFDSQDTAAVNASLEYALGSLVALKRAHPGHDATTRLIAHPTRMTDQELIHQILTIYAAASEPLTNLIANTLALMLANLNRFLTSAEGPGLPTVLALLEMLADDPPMANHCIVYPHQPADIDGIWVPPHQPVIVSMTACSADAKQPRDSRHAATSTSATQGELSGSAWHLGFGAGPHACPAPARNLAEQVARQAIDYLLDLLPLAEMEIDTSRPMRWRPGPFH